jgi:hypothetical protein
MAGQPLFPMAPTGTLLVFDHDIHYNVSSEWLLNENLIFYEALEF